MANPWFPSNCASVLSPQRLTPGESPLPDPPDPPDPDNPLSLARFPPLSSPSPKSSRASVQTALSSRAALKSPNPPTATGLASAGQVSDSTVLSGSGFPRSGSTVPKTMGNFKVLPPKNSSPMQTNKASSAIRNNSFSVPVFPVSNPASNPASNPFSTSNPASNPALNPAPNPSPVKEIPVSNPPLVASLPPKPSPSGPSPVSQFGPSSSASPPLQPDSGFTPPPAPSHIPLVEKIRRREDKTLERLAPMTLSEKGVPRVLIPDSVFAERAELHKDFIICYFNGRPPPFHQIQSVLNHMWGKGKRVEVHTNPLSRSMLVRIPSDYLKQKIIEKGVWYIGESMFHAVQWSSSASAAAPPPQTIQIWAHLTGIPLDLRHNAGLSLVAGLVGDPKETDDFTKNLVSLTLSHVKVAVKLTDPLPNVVEFVRQSGEVVEVQVSYPWTPPTCSHCKELGHVARNCLLLPPPVRASANPAKNANASATGSQKEKSVASKKTAQTNAGSDASASSSSNPTVAPSNPVAPSYPVSTPNPVSSPNPVTTPNPPAVPSPPPSDPPPALIPTSPILPSSLSSPALAAFATPVPFIPSDPLSPPDSFFAPSLKRPRPDPCPLSFPSFTAQLSFVASSSSIALPLALPSPSFVTPSFNPFSVLDPDGSLHHEETID